MTKKPLIQMIPEILQYVNTRWEPNIVYAREQRDIYQGDVKTHVERSIRNEILSPKALQSTLERIIPINLLKQTTDKLSSAYDANISRESKDEADQEWLDWYIDKLCLDQQMTLSNKMFNLHNYVGLEPFIKDGKPQLRILDASRYIPYTDDALDPTNPTVIIKWITNIRKFEPATDSEGRKQQNAKEVIREVKLYYIYSDTEVLFVDADGQVQKEMMKEAGVDGTHTLGMLPVIHVPASAFDLVPLQDTSKRDITISVSKKLTDLSYASLYQSHSLLYGIDVEVNNLDSNPDAFLSFVSSEKKDGSAGSGQIGILQPKVNIPESLQLINAEVSMHLKSLGLNPGQAEQGATNTASVASGVSKMIDEAGSEKVTNEQRTIFKKAEENGLWPLLAKLHQSWLASGQVDFKKGVSESIEVDTIFQPKKPSESESVIIERIQKKLEARLTSRKRAISEANPDLDAVQVDELIAEIDAESELKIDVSGIFPTQKEDNQE